MLKIILQHKVIVGIIILIIVGGGYFGYKTFKGNGGETRYVLAAVEKGTLIVSVSGSGQISALNQVDVKSKTSGDIIYLGIKNAQEIKAGTLIAKIDPVDAQKAVRDAEINLEEAQFELSKMKGTETATGYIRGVKEKAADDLAKAYEDGFNTVSNAFLDLPSVITGLDNILFGYSITKISQNIDYYTDYAKAYDDKASQYKIEAYNSYKKARAAYDKNIDDYKTVSRFSDGETIGSLINETYDTTKDISEAIRNIINLIQFYQDKFTEHGLTSNTVSDTHLSSLNSYTGKVTSYLSSLFSIENTIETNKENLIQADYDIADQEIQVRKMQDALDDANKNLSYCSIYAPFDGVITEVKIKNSDSVSDGTTIATLVTKKNIAEISLNEIDAAKVKVGQKVTLSFDAIPDLSITGEVVELDTVGTVTQGVVTYNAKIGFDTQDERVKPGMSVSAAIITDTRQDVLFVSSSVVKQQGDISYVQIMTESGVPQSRVVTVGLSNDTMTEVISGLKEGDKVVTQTTTTQTSTQSNSQNSERGGFMIMEGGGPLR